MMSGYKSSKFKATEDAGAMGPEDFLHFVKSTGGRKGSPNG